MPTSCVPDWRCGTHVTGWMNGTHPTVTEGNVPRKMCYNWSIIVVTGQITWPEVVNCEQYHFYK